jgi:peroxiredoxin
VQLDGSLPKFGQRGVDLVGVTFDDLADLLAFGGREELGITLARDPGGKLARALNVLHENVGPVKETFYPTKILIDPKDNRVLWVYAEDDLRVRLGPEAVLAAIDSALK